MGRFDCHSLSKIGCLWLEIVKGLVSRLSSLFYHASLIIVESRFNEVPRDWLNFFFISRVRYIEPTSFLRFSPTRPYGAREVGERT